MGAVAINLWLVWVIIPLWMGHPAGPQVVVCGVPVLLIPAMLVWLAPWLLLVAYPLACALVVGVMPSLVTGVSHPPVALLVGALSVLAYGAVVGQAVTRPRFSEVEAKPLDGVGGEDGGRRRSWVRRAMLVTTGLGSLILATLAPTLGGDRALRNAWGGAALEAGVLTAIVGGALGTIALVAFVGPATRKRRRPPSPQRSRNRVFMLLVVVVVGVFVWLNMRRHMG